MKRIIILYIFLLNTSILSSQELKIFKVTLIDDNISNLTLIQAKDSTGKSYYIIADKDYSSNKVNRELLVELKKGIDYCLKLTRLDSVPNFEIRSSYGSGINYFNETDTLSINGVPNRNIVFYKSSSIYNKYYIKNK